MSAPNIIRQAERQDDLATLARRIRQQHQQIGATGLTLAQMFDVGDLLIAARGLVPCRWNDWLSSECCVPASASQLYRRLSRHRDKIKAGLAREKLSLRAARQLIAKPRTSAQPVRNLREMEPAGRA
jgi:hypothetical protein